ncbi:MAG: S8 family serine peptidase [Pseudobdellovibrionaceae bacterium]
MARRSENRLSHQLQPVSAAENSALMSPQFFKKIGLSYKYIIVFTSMLFSVNAVAADAIPGEFLIKYKPLAVDSQTVQGKIYGKANLKGAFPSLNLYHVSLKAGAADTVSYEALKNDPDVEFIEPNYIFKKSVDEPTNQVLSHSTRDDVVQASQNSTQSFSQNGASVKVQEGWNIASSIAAKGKIIVAVVDTGLDSTHDVFKTVASGGTGAVWTNAGEISGNGVDDDFNGFIDDVHGWNFITNTNNFYDDEGHGTHVSGIIVGTSLDIMAATLDESKITIMPLKFLDSNGSGSTSNAIRAIYYAVNNGAKVINNSWGGSSYSRSLNDAFSYAYQHHVVLVSAAGNYSKNNDSNAMFPANYDVPSNISVASTTDTDNLSSFSNYGVSKVPVTATGSYITSTIPGNYYGVMSGTSMASPFVAGLAAMALREASQLTGYQIKQLIQGQVDVKSNLSTKISTSGRVNLYKSILQAQALTSASASQPVYIATYAEEKTSSGGGGGSGSSDGGGGKGGCGLVSTASLTGPGNGGGLARSLNLFLYLSLVTAPLVVWIILRQKKLSRPQDQRKHDRFKMSSKVSISLGDRQLTGSIRTISAGGVSFNATEALEKGGIVSMKIQSPDGTNTIEVEGHVVWSEQNQNYGVQFNNASDGVKGMIQQWTKNLIKAS